MVCGALDPTSREVYPMMYTVLRILRMINILMRGMGSFSWGILVGGLIVVIYLVFMGVLPYGD